MPTPAELADAYLAGAARLRAAVAGMSRAQLVARPVPGKWSTLEVVAHLADFEVVFLDRIQRVIALDGPTLPAADERAYTAALHPMERDVEEEVALVEAVRRKGSRLIRRLTPDQLTRTGTHTEAGRMTLEQFINYPVTHVDHHLPFIAEKRKALGL